MTCNSIPDLHQSTFVCRGDLRSIRRPCYLVSCSTGGVIGQNIGCRNGGRMTSGGHLWPVKDCKPGKHCSDNQQRRHHSSSHAWEQPGPGENCSSLLLPWPEDPCIVIVMPVQFHTLAGASLMF